MKLLGIPTAVHYPEALHLQPAFAYLGHRKGDFPVAEAAASRVVSLPMHPYLTEDDLVQIAEAVTECAEKTKGNLSLRGAALV
jgi:UDP-2-acetamido-2-deoxy-ribo-hexuluronate aminotransferase